MSVQYKNRIFCKLSPFHQRRLKSGAYMYQCPGCLPHVEELEAEGRHVPFKLFDRWQGRGNKAYGLYWRIQQLKEHT